MACCPICPGDLLVLARAVLKAQEWRAHSPEYGRLQTKYQTELRAIIKQRFDQFAVLRTWSFTDPTRCKFHVENLGTQGSRIPPVRFDEGSTAGGSLFTKVGQRYGKHKAPMSNRNPVAKVCQSSPGNAPGSDPCGGQPNYLLAPGRMRSFLCSKGFEPDT